MKKSLLFLEPNTLRDSDSNPGFALNSFPSLRFLIYYSDTKNKIIQTRCGIISFYLWGL